jgi:hypothetical protein
VYFQTRDSPHSPRHLQIRHFGSSMPRLPLLRSPPLLPPLLLPSLPDIADTFPRKSKVKWDEEMVSEQAPRGSRVQSKRGYKGQPTLARTGLAGWGPLLHPVAAHKCSWINFQMFLCVCVCVCVCGCVCVRTRVCKFVYIYDHGRVLKRVPPRTSSPSSAQMMSENAPAKLYHYPHKGHH